MVYSRQNPSPEYLKNVELGKQYHRTHKTWNGKHSLQQFPILRQLCKDYQTKNILDVGSGKNQHLSATNIRLLNTKDDEEKTIYPSWQEALGVSEIFPYDPCISGHDILPDRRFDGVMSVDVLHYISKDDISWFIDMMFSFAQQWVFSLFALYPGTKTLADGTEAHKTFETVGWWVEKWYEVGLKYPNISWFIRIEPSSPPISHRYFVGQGKSVEEKTAPWKIWKPQQLIDLTKKQREELEIAAKKDQEVFDLNEIIAKFS